MGDPVGIVLVSHSASLAAGLAELVLQIGVGSLPVQPAGGTSDGALGTSDARVREAIKRADRGSGVVILADLGSAVLTVKAVLADEPRADVLLVDAPFVEGAVAAAVISATGAELAAVAAAAREAWDVRKL